MEDLVDIGVAMAKDLAGFGAAEIAKDLVKAK